MNRTRLLVTISILLLFSGCFRSSNGVSSPSYSTSKFFVTVDNQEKEITAYLVKEITYDSKKVKIWIDSSQYNDNMKNQAISLASQFLNGSNKNDIYHYMTNLFGNEWGGIDNQLFIDNTNTMHILVTPLNNSYSNSFVVGYFNPLDTIKNGNYSFGAITRSNEKNMFYIDSNLLSGNLSSSVFSTEEKASIKKEVYSTLAHEFTHMIVFYQKDILKNADTDTWLNEMIAMMGEDLVDDKITVDGKTGVEGPKNRISSFNQMYNDYDINDADGSFDIGDYAIGALYGMYLSRSYGYKDASFYRNLVQSDKSSYDAIEYAINGITSTNVSFLETIKNFGKAVILSNNEKGNMESSSDKIYYLNRTIPSLTYSSTVGYNFEPINVFDSSYSNFVYKATTSGFTGGANTYLKLKSSSDSGGVKEWVITLPDGGKYKITGTLTSSDSVYVIFNGTNVEYKTNYGSIALSQTLSSISSNIVGQESSIESRIIDKGPELRDKVKGLKLLNTVSSKSSKNMSSVSGNITFQIIVSDENGFNSTKTSGLEGSVTKI